MEAVYHLNVQAIPAMLLALVFSFDHQKCRDSNSTSDASSTKGGHNYGLYATVGYALGLVSALAAGVLTHSPQPALLYLVCIFIIMQCYLVHPCYAFLLLHIVAHAFLGSAIDHTILALPKSYT